MKKGNLIHESHRSPDGLTKKDKKAVQPENIVNRDFTAKEANVKWLTDITQTPCKDGKLYIAPVMDCFGGEIISLAMDSNMKKELCIKAAKEAFMLRKPKSGFIFHSDAGSQYTSLKYKIELGKMHAIHGKFLCNAEKRKTLSAGYNENDHGRSKNGSMEICSVLQPDKNLHFQ